MAFARHGTLANLESTLAQRHAQFVTSRPGVTAHEDDDLQYMRSSFHTVRDSLLGASRPAAAATFSAASGQRRSPPKAADRVPDYSIAHPVSRPARELGLLVDPDQVPIPRKHAMSMCILCSYSCACTHRICMCTADTLHKIITRAVSMPYMRSAHAYQAPSDAEYVLAQAARAKALVTAQRAADTARAIARASPHRPSHRPASHMHYAAAPTTREGTCAGPTTPSRAPSRPPNLESVRQARYSLSVSCHKPRLPHALVSYSSPDSSPSGTQGWPRYSLLTAFSELLQPLICCSPSTAATAACDAACSPQVHCTSRRSCSSRRRPALLAPSRARRPPYRRSMTRSRAWRSGAPCKRAASL